MNPFKYVIGVDPATDKDHVCIVVLGRKQNRYFVTDKMVLTRKSHREAGIVTPFFQHVAEVINKVSSVYAAKVVVGTLGAGVAILEQLPQATACDVTFSNVTSEERALGFAITGFNQSNGNSYSFDIGRGLACER